MNQAADSFKLAQHHHRAGRFGEAERIYRAILSEHPEHPETLHQLGLLAHQLGRAAEAVDWLSRVVRHAGRNPVYLYHYALALKADGDLQGAGRALGKAVRLKPDFAQAHNELGVVQKRLGRLDAAIASYRAALQARPDYVDAHFNLGIAQQAAGRTNAAIECYTTALQLNPDDAEALTNLGNLYQRQNRYDEALACYRRALEIRPEFTEAHSNLLYTLSYNVLCPPEDMLREHRAWDRVQGAAGRAHVYAHAPDGDPDRRLRIGYVSPDLWRHSVSFFFEPILEGHDRDQVEVYCYAQVSRPDEVTERLQGLADGWRWTVGVDDAGLAQRIHADGIDILVDLAGHTAGNRLRAFTYKPAPVQATYLGYFTTTGLESMDYWISDATLHGEGTTELATEEIYRLPRCSVCYRPPPEAPAVAERPPSGPVTFGSFNHLSKISPQAVALWSEVVKSVPGSRLLLKTRQLADPEVARRVRDQFEAQGVDPERLTLRGHTPSAQAHFAAYGEMDIALDTVPRTGGTTTADALWMGVPVITLAGERFIERLSATMVAGVGLDECIAESGADFVARAAALAADPGRRTELRAGLRDRMAGSELCDGAGLARTLEAAYREMWRKFLSEA